MSRKIVNGKVTISQVEINVKHVLQWMKETGHFVTSVEARDHFKWPMRQTCRSLMKLLAEENKVVIVENPKRKRSWIYGLPNMKKPTKETFVKPKAAKESKKAEKKNKSRTCKYL